VELLVVIGIIALLIAILLPVLSKARKAAAAAKCMSNLKQLMSAVQMYANDHQGYIVYTGLGDGPGKPRGGDYYANWLYNPNPPPAGSPLGVGTVTTGFNPADVQSGALYEYLNAPGVYRCPLDNNPQAFSTDGNNTPLFNALGSYIMNSWLVNYNKDDNNPNAANNTGFAQHHLHKMNEYHPYDVAFWDYPAGGNVFAGVTYSLHKSDPSGDGTDRPSVSGRHAGKVTVDANNATFTNQISGGVPTAFLDGHVELWPIYAFENAMTSWGPPQGSSPMWCSPNTIRGGNGVTSTTTMTDIFSPS
jgi:prepilin-type processing-associated H-X9-DG protein